MRKRPSRIKVTHFPNTLLRILDANLNRAKEALRVGEDIVRFGLNEELLSKRWKSCRHQISQAFLKMPLKYQLLLNVRDSENDVGKSSHIADKKKKQTLKDLLIANLKRAQESLRVLEEVSKVIAPKLSGRFQKIRFDTYVLEKDTLSKF